MEQTQELPRLQLQRDQEQRELENALFELEKLSEQVANTLDDRTELRKAKVAELNGHLQSLGVKLLVEPLAQQQSLLTLRQGHSEGAKIYDELSSKIQGEVRYHRRLARSYQSLRNDLIDGYALFFSASEFYFFLEVFEEDDLKVFFKVGKAGEEYSPIDQLSAGQRCTAIFPLLLKLQEGPLIVDQPEDNLDNRHIATNIAPGLMRDKLLRQVAFTSHNANLVVLTDAEHIASFEGSGSEGRIEERGFLVTSRSPITRQVLDILDGGEKALELRQRKYGSTFEQR